MIPAHAAEHLITSHRLGPDRHPMAVAGAAITLVEHPTEKQKFLYVLGTEHVDNFLNGGRAISSELGRNVKLGKEYTEKYGNRYRKVRDYYLARKDLVVVQDVSSFVPELVAASVEATEVEGE